MTKTEFLDDLRKRLSGLPKDDVNDRINFYDEMIDDIMEDGKTEEEAIMEIGGIDGVVNKIAEDTPLSSLVKEKMKPSRRLKAWEIVLIVAGFPVWFPLLVTAIVLLLVCLLLTWVLVLVAYSVELAFIVGSIAAIVLFFIYLPNGAGAIVYLGGGIALGGLSILFFYGCQEFTKLIIKLNKAIILGIKKMLIGGGKDKWARDLKFY